MVMGGDSCSKGRGFESCHRFMDGHFFTFISCKNCNVCLKRPKIKKKDASVGPFFNIRSTLLSGDTTTMRLKQDLANLGQISFIFNFLFNLTIIRQIKIQIVVAIIK